MAEEGPDLPADATPDPAADRWADLPPHPWAGPDGRLNDAGRAVLAAVYAAFPNGPVPMVRARWPRLWASLWGMVRNGRLTVEDAEQEMWAAAARGIARFRPGGGMGLTGWLALWFRSACGGTLRRQIKACDGDYRTASLDWAMADVGMGGAEFGDLVACRRTADPADLAAAGAAGFGVLDAAVGRLGWVDRDALRMAYAAGLTWREAGAECGAGMGDAARRGRRAVGLVRRAVRRDRRLAAELAAMGYDADAELAGRTAEGR